MLIRMRVEIDGGINGGPWPPVGGTIELPDHVAVELIADGRAEEASPEPVTETATMEPVTETAVKRGPGRPRKAAN